MHVCILNEFFYPDIMGGTPKVLSELGVKLHRQHGIEVSAVTSCNSYREPGLKYPPFENWEGIKIHRVDSPHWTSKRTAQRMAGNLIFTHRATRRLLKDIHCDVVLVSTAPVTLPMAAQTYLHRRKVPYVYVVYDLDPDRTVALGVADADGLPVRTLKRQQKRWLHGAESVVAIGRCMRDVLSDKYEVPAHKIHVIEVGADTEKIRPDSGKNSFREKQGIHDFVVLYTGNFGKYHDFDTLLDAAKIILAKDAKVTIVLVGRGAKKAHIQDRIKREEISNVRMFDFVPDEEYGDLLASANISLVTLEAGMEGLCVPSKFYSILASGRPTLALMRDTSEVAKVVREENIGMVVALGDPESLAKAILDAHERKAELKGQGERARIAFENNYSTDIIAQKFATVLKAAGARPRS